MSNLNREDVDPQGTQEWIESLEDEIEEYGFERTRHLLEKLVDYATTRGARLSFNKNTYQRVFEIIAEKPENSMFQKK